jgi:hypothetical protein
MKKDAETHDTEPIDPPAARGADSHPSDHDTDDFLRWLPTMSLGDRRRRELVRRPSSDGADFAAYACVGRAPAPSVRPPRDVYGKRRPQSPTQGEAAHDSHGPERDAPTVLTPRTIAGRRRMLAGWGAVGLIAASAALSAQLHRPTAPRKAIAQPAAFAMPSVPVVDRAERIEPPESPPALPPNESQRIEPAPEPSLPKSPAARRIAPGRLLAKGEGHAKGPATAPTAIDTSATSRRSPFAEASALPAKDQYFETQ